MNQLQHTISQVYLKEFGYLEENNQWKVSVLELQKIPLMESRGKKWFSQKSIGSFTAFENIFDLPFENVEGKKLFEEQCAMFENKIPKLIEVVKSEKPLNKEHENALYNYISNLIVRSTAYRDIVAELLAHPEKRLGFLKEVTSYHLPTQESKIAFLNKLKVEFQLNFALIFMMTYFRCCLSSFEYRIFKAVEGKNWFTSDNPVVLIDNVSADWIFADTSQLYFPLTKDYCFYLNYPDSPKKNALLTSIEPLTYNVCSENIQSHIQDLISKNAYHYAIIPTKLTDWEA